MNGRIEAMAARLGGAVAVTAAAVNRKKGITPAEFKARAAARRRAMGFGGNERREAYVLGLQRFARRFAEGGDGVTAERITAAADRAAVLLAAHNEQRMIAERPRQDYVGAAAAQAARGFVKCVPGAFATVEDCADWLKRHLPFSEASATMQAELDVSHKATKTAMRALREFGEVVEHAAALVFADLVNSDKNLQKLAEAGRE